MKSSKINELIKILHSNKYILEQSKSYYNINHAENSFFTWVLIKYTILESLFTSLLRYYPKLIDSIYDASNVSFEMFWRYYYLEAGRKVAKISEECISCAFDARYPRRI